MASANRYASSATRAAYCRGASLFDFFGAFVPASRPLSAPPANESRRSMFSFVMGHLGKAICGNGAKGGGRQPPAVPLLFYAATASPVAAVAFTGLLPPQAAGPRRAPPGGPAP